MLFTTAFPEEMKTGETINRELRRQFVKFGFSAELFDAIIFVTDQGANIIKALESQIRLDCNAHLINTFLRHTFQFNFTWSEVLMIHDTVHYSKYRLTLLLTDFCYRSNHRLRKLKLTQVSQSL